MQIKCPHCHAEYDVEPEHIGRNIQCPLCSNDFEVVNPNLTPCPDCFTLISKRAYICPKCGAPLLNQAPDTSKTAANPVQSVPAPPKPAADSGNSDISREREIETYHPSAMNYFWAILVGILTIPLAIGILILLYIALEIKFTNYTLTTHRIIVRKGWIAKHQSEIWIKDMRGVNLAQGIWQRIVGIGDIFIGTAASAGTEISIIGIANPAEVAARINSLR